MSNETPTIDNSALKTNQAAIILLTLSGFVFDVPLLPAIVSAVMILGTFIPALALFKQFYRHVLKPAGLIAPAPLPGSARPHEFAQLFGGIVLGIGACLLFAGETVAGWSLAWIVILLAATNLFLGFCAGCFVYFQLGRFGVPGFAPDNRERSPE
jgi:hypothetical protein